MNCGGTKVFSHKVVRKYANQSSICLKTAEFAYSQTVFTHVLYQASGFVRKLDQFKRHVLHLTTLVFALKQKRNKLVCITAHTMTETELRTL